MPNFNFVNLAVYLVLIIFLSLYHFWAKREGHKLKMPVGLFVCYFLVLTAATVLKPFSEAGSMETFSLIAMIFLALAVVRLLTFVFIDFLLAFRRSVTIPLISRDIGLAVIYIIVVLVILRYKANVNLASLITTSAVLTAVIGLAMQDTLGNLFSGIILQLEKPYHLDDWVSFDNYTGKVVGMTWKSTKILTGNKELVCIPNNLIAKSKILNYSQPDPQHIAVFKIGTSYDDPPNRVREVILASLAEHPKVDRTPPPEVRVVQYNDFSIDYAVRFHISDFENEERVKSHILNQLWYRFGREGITIPFPIRKIEHMHADPAKETSKRENCTQRALAALKNIDVLKPLSGEDFTNLSLRARFEVFSAGEFIITEGATGDSMYVIIEGECDILIKEGETEGHVVASLKKNQVFGEMSLLTGEPRSATVRAKTDMTCIEIKKEDVEDILRSHPAVVESISEILAVRKMELESKRDGIKDALRKPDQNLAAQFLTKIRSFFSI